MDTVGEHPGHEMVGLVGAGLLGQAIATRLLAAGVPVIGWDVHESARDALVEARSRAIAQARREREDG